MSTPLQTGARTGTSSQSPRRPEGPADKLRTAWHALSLRTRRTVLLAASSVLLAVSGGFAISTATRPVPLYAAPLSPSDAADVQRRLTELGIPFSVEGARLLVPPARRTQAIASLLAAGLPRRTPLPVATSGGSWMPAGAADRERQDVERIQHELEDELRQVDVVADARVTVVPASTDTLPSERTPASATVLLTVKPGTEPSAMQMQSVLHLVTYTVRGLKPEDVSITDTSGRIWSDRGKIVADGGRGGDEHLEIKQAYEKEYREKIQRGLQRMVGGENYALAGH